MLKTETGVGLTALETVAEITPIGTGARLVLKKTASLTELEKRLGILLAGEDEGNQALRKFYAGFGYPEETQ